MAAAGIRRERCLIANVFRYRPPDNKIAHFFASRRRALLENDPVAEEWGKLGAEYVRARFAGEIEALGAVLKATAAPVVVALGRTPLWALAGLNGITSLRGRVLPNRLGNAQLIATYHPSYVMRQNSIGPETEATFRADLKAALELATVTA